MAASSLWAAILFLVVHQFASKTTTASTGPESCEETLITTAGKGIVPCSGKIFLDDNTTFRFSVKACDRAWVRFNNENSVALLDIIIVSNASSLHDFDATSGSYTLRAKKNHSPLACGEFRSFYISWQEEMKGVMFEEGFVGCFPEDRKSIVFKFNPGQADPDRMSPSLCSSYCVAFGQQFSALYSGRFCFCGDEAPKSPEASSSACSIPCSGQPERGCGGIDHIGVYKNKIPEPITGLYVTSKVIEITSTDSTVFFDFRVTSGNNTAAYRVDYGDGAGFTVLHAQEISHYSFHLPGTYAVHLVARDIFGYLQPKHAVTTVRIQMAPRFVSSLRCPPLWAIGAENTCDMAFYEGSSLSVTLLIDGSAVPSPTFNIADPVFTGVGPGIQRKNPVLATTYQGFIIAPASLVETGGLLVAVDVFLAVPGTVKISVLSPNCGVSGGGTYCLETNTCSALCTHSASLFTCLACRDCVMCNTTSRFSSSSLKVPHYTVTKDFEISFSTPGFHHERMTDEMIQLLPGDILAYRETVSTGKLSWLDCPKEQINFIGPDTSPGNTLQSSQAYATDPGHCMALRAVLAEESKVLLQRNFTAPGTQIMGVTIAENRDNNRTSLTVNTTVQVLTPVASIDGPDYVQTGTSHTFTVLLEGESPPVLPTTQVTALQDYYHLDHNTGQPGEAGILWSPSVNWTSVSPSGCLTFSYRMDDTDMGSLSVLRTTTSDRNNVAYVWSQSGFKEGNMSWTAVQITVDTSTRVKFLIEGIRGRSSSGVIHVKTVQIQRGKCPDPTMYTWDFGDGTVLTATSPINHTYTSWGNYSMNVTSPFGHSALRPVQVQDPVQGLSVRGPLYVETGVPFLFQIYLSNGSHYTCRWSLDDGTINISNAEITPVGRTTNVMHTYTDPRDYNVHVNCSNQVSWEDHSLRTQAQDRISGLELSQPWCEASANVNLRWTIATGTNVTWNAIVFNGSPYVPSLVQTNRLWETYIGSLSYGTYPVYLEAQNEISWVNLSTNFISELVISDPWATVSSHNLTTGTDFQVTVSASHGSEINVTVDYGDGFIETQHFPGHTGIQPAYSRFTRFYRRGGNHTIKVTFSNHVSSKTETIQSPVEVLVGPKHLDIKGLERVLRYPPRLGRALQVDITFDTGPNGSFPENGTCEIDLLDNRGVRKYALLENSSFVIGFVKTGKYTITAKLYNDVETKIFSHTLWVVELMISPRIELDPGITKAPYGQPFNIHFVMFTGPTGENCNLIWDFGNGNVSQGPRQGEGQDGRDTKQVTYTILGTYNVSVLAVGDVENKTVYRIIEVIYPFVEQHINVTVSKTTIELGEGVQVTMTWTHSDRTHIPTDPWARLDFRDGTVVKKSITITAAQQSVGFSHKYVEDGLYDISILLYNEASRVDKTLQVGVYQKFTSLDVQICYRPTVPRSVMCKNGLENQNKSFPVDKEITFNVTSNAYARWYYFEATYEDGSTINSNQTNGFFIIKNMTKPGKWDVSITASNPIDKAKITRTLEMIEMIVNFTITHDKKENKPGEKKTFGISFEVQGYKTCLKVDFDDGTQALYADDKSFCASVSASLGVEDEWQGVLTNRTEISHVFVNESTYNVIAVASNRYQNITHKLTINITGISCTSPELVIENATHIFYKPHVYKKGDLIKFRGIPLIDCSKFENIKTWYIEEIDQDWGNVTRLVDLAGTVTDKAELLLDRWLLDYELYRVTFDMYMIHPETKLSFLATDYSYFRVEKSDLVGILYLGGTTEITAGVSTGKLTLTPLRFSHDPDVKNNDPAKSNISVDSWSCKYRNSPEGLYSVPVWADCNNTSYSASKGSDGFMDMPLSSDMEKRTYNWTVHLTKDTREVSTSLTVHLVGINPHNITIACVGGSTCFKTPTGYLVPKTSRLGFRAVCSSCLQNDSIKYEWTVYVKDFRWLAYGGWRPLRETDTIFSNRIYGESSPEVAITPKLFVAMNDSVHYKAGCKVTANGVEGEAAVEFSLNTPPLNGSCSIEPKQHVVTTEEKPFQITCQGWKTDSKIAKYEFFACEEKSCKPYTFNYTASDDGAMTQLAWQTTHDSNVAVNVAVPQGRKRHNYVTHVKVVIKDVIGSATEYYVGNVSVTPAPVEKICKLIETTPDDPDSPLVRKSSEGDLIHFTEYANTLNSIVNLDRLENACLTGNKGSANTSDEADTTTVATTTATTMETTTEEESKLEIYEKEQKRNNRARLREKLLERMDLLPLNDMISVAQIASTMQDSLKFKDEVTTETQTKAMDVLVKMSERLTDTESITREDRMKTLKFIIGAQGNSLAAGGVSGFKGTLEMLDQAEETNYFEDYDPFNEAKDDPCLGSFTPSDIDDAVDMKKKLANCIDMRKKSKSLGERWSKVNQKVLASFGNNSIQNEEQEFNTDNQQTKLTMIDAQGMAGEKYMQLHNSSASVVFSQNFSKAIAEDSNSPNDSFVLELSENTDIPLRYTEDAKKVVKDSGIVSVNILWRPGDGSPPKYVTPPTVEHLRRRKKRDVDQALGVPSAHLTLKIPNRGARKLNEKKIHAILPPTSLYLLHCTEISREGASLHAKICIDKPDVHFVVVFSLGTLPNHLTGHCNASFIIPHEKSKKAGKRCSTAMMDNEQMNDFLGTAYVGVRQLLPNETDLDVSDCLQLPSYWKNGTGILDEAGETVAGFTSNYSIDLFTSGCYGKSADGDDAWSSKGLRVHPDTDEGGTVCVSEGRLGVFASGWAVAPNSIDWNFVFSHLDFFTNPTLYATQIAIALLYIVAAILARRKDKKDIELLGFAPLMDNDPRHQYFYEIEVTTGLQRNSGTKSRVFFVLSGDGDETDVREFTDSKREIFRRGATNNFLMATPRSLGTVQYARIWHDNSGVGNFGSWFLDHMTVKDVQTGERWIFIAKKWFAVEEDDGKTDRVIYTSGNDKMTEFSHKFSERSKRSLIDEHLWFSILARPPGSRFTCVQRVSCCLCLLYTTMLASVMFYKGEDGGTTAKAASVLQIGPFQLSAEQVITGVISNLIVFPVSVVIIMLFRKSRPRQSKVTNAQTVWTTSQTSIMGGKSTGSPQNDVEQGRLAAPTSVRGDKSARGNKKKWSLPWWCRIVAWALLWFTTVLSAFFVSFYGITFGDEKCRKWITSLLISFFTSVFLTQPVKVFLLAFVLSLLFKKSAAEDEEEGEEKKERDENEDKIKKHGLADDEVPLHDVNGETFKYGRHRKEGCAALTVSQLKEARLRRLKEVHMWAAFREILVYVVFISVLLFISYRTTSSNTYLYKETLERVFIRDKETDVSFDMINNTDHFWQWAKTGLLNGLLAGPYYNKLPPLMLRGYINDKVSKIVGYAMMRQLRVKPSQCVLDRRMSYSVRECNAKYSIGTQEEGTFDIGWKPRTGSSTDNDTAEWYRYRKADELGGYPYWGRLAVYSGGGYVVKLQGSRQNLSDVMARLEEEGWIDRYTRAVIVEFTTYNAQVNLFGINTIMTEFDPAGGTVEDFHFESALLLPYVTSSFYVQVACEIVYALFTIGFVVRIIICLVKEKAKFLVEFWNLVDLGIVSLSFAAMIVYFYRFFETSQRVSSYKKTEGLEYVNFQFVRYWNELYGYFVAFIVFLATLKFLRLLRFNQRMSLIGATLQNSSRSLVHFSAIFWIVFVAFSMLFYFTFLTVDKRYSTFIDAIVSQIILLLGKVDIVDLFRAEQVLGPIFFFLFSLTVTFIIINMFVSILNDAFDSVRKNDFKELNDYEIVQYLMERVKDMANRGGRKNKVVAPENVVVEEPVSSDSEDEIDYFPQRVERLFAALAQHYGRQDDQEWEDDVNALRMTSLVPTAKHGSPRP